MIKADRDKVTGNKLTCLLRRGKIYLPENQEKGREQKHIYESNDD